MIKFLKVALLAAFGLFIMPSANAQKFDPTSWEYEVKKLKGSEYQLIFHATLEPKWHIWSMSPGGDGSLVATFFKFYDNSKLNLKGKISERGTVITTVLEGITGKVMYYENKVDYIQKVLVEGPATITGEQVYQVCNDSLCLPPITKRFSFNID